MNLKNKTILITGGTGSFGNAFIFELLKYSSPKKVIIFSRDEFKQFEMSQKFPKSKFKFIRFFIGDVREKERLEYATKNVDIIIHAAALKQINTAEYNPWEYIKTNINGAQNVIDCAIKNKVDKVIALSTDKAADPISLYGATKFTSDKLFVAANNITGKIRTKFSVVRYGNVASSRGSVIPFFQKLIKENSSYIPITDKRMTRFFISLNESTKFVLHCLKLMKGGEIFVPKIPSIKITDLAETMAPKIKKKIIGIRPGEKLHEIMCPQNSANYTIEFNNFYIITPSIIFLDRKKVNYLRYNSKIKGAKVKDSFEYSSDKNKVFLKGQMLKKKLAEFF
jgi:UDP-N-acetylglucosamine 4,6-dehydratase/5-epimerase